MKAPASEMTSAISRLRKPVTRSGRHRFGEAVGFISLRCCLSTHRAQVRVELRNPVSYAVWRGLPHATIFSNSVRRRSGDLSFLRPYFSFHGGLSLQALQIARDRCDSESATAFLIRHGTIARLKAPIDLDPLPLLSMAHLIDGHILVFTPQEWHGFKLFPPPTP